jgi:hypothetical protein
MVSDAIRGSAIAAIGVFSLGLTPLTLRSPARWRICSVRGPRCSAPAP